MTIWFTSDTHFGHSNIIKFQETRRHFKTVDEMNDTLIKNYNDRVGNDDTVYHLGDVALAKDKETSGILAALNGKIHLVCGNHDRQMKAYNKSRFASIQDYLELRNVYNEQMLVLCHYPFLVWRNSHYGSWHLHGHSHGSAERRGKRLDVGVDCFNMAPVSLDTIAGMLEFAPIELGDYHGKTDIAVDNQTEGKDK